MLDTEHTEISKARTLSSRSSQSIGKDRYDANNSNSNNTSKKKKKRASAKGSHRGSIKKNGVLGSRTRFQEEMVFEQNFVEYFRMRKCPMH